MPLLTYVLIETHIKGVCTTSSDKDSVLWIGFVKNDHLVDDILVLQKSAKMCFFLLYLRGLNVTKLVFSRTVFNICYYR